MQSQRQTNKDLNIQRICNKKHRIKRKKGKKCGMWYERTVALSRFTMADAYLWCREKEDGRVLQTAEAKASIKSITFPLKSFFLSLGFSRSVSQQPAVSPSIHCWRGLMKLWGNQRGISITLYNYYFGCYYVDSLLLLYEDIYIGKKSQLHEF